MAESSFNPTGTTAITGTPNTFAGSNPEPVVSKEPAFSGVAPQGGITGGNITAPNKAVNLSADAPNLESMMGGLLDLAMPIIKPKLEQAKQNAIWDGMQRAAAGEAVETMAAEQNPILSFLGVEAPALKGARMYTSTAVAAKAAADLQDRMGEFATMDGPAAAQAMRETLMQSMSNVDDAQTRSMIEAQYTEMLPRLVIQQAKSRIAHVKNELANTAVDAAVVEATAFEKLQQGVRDKTVNSTELQQNADRFREIVEAPPGTDVADWRGVTLRQGNELLANGNLAAYDIFKSTKAYQNLTPEQRRELERKEEPAFQYAQRYKPQWQNDVTDKAQLLGALQQGVSGFTTEAELLQHMDNRNAEVERTSGFKSKPEYDNQEKAQYLAAWQAGQARLAAAQAGAGDNDQMIALIDRKFNTGGIGDLAGVPKDMVGSRMDFWATEAIKEQDPEKRAVLVGKFTAAIAADPDMKPTLMMQQLNRDWSAFKNGAPLTDKNLTASFAIVSELLQTPNGKTALSRMIGEDDAIAVQSLYESGVDPNDPDAVNHARTMIQRAPRVQVTPDQRTAAADKLDSAVSTMPWADGRLAGMNLNEGSRRELTRQAAETFARYQIAYPGVSEEDAMSYALDAAIKGGEAVNGMWINRNPLVKDGGTLQSKVKMLRGNVTQQEYDRATALATKAQFNAALKKQGIDPAKYPFSDYETVAGQNIGGGRVMITLRPAKQWGLDGKAIGPTGLTLLVSPEHVALNIDSVRKADREAMTRKLQPPTVPGTAGMIAPDLNY